MLFQLSMDNNFFIFKIKVRTLWIKSLQMDCTNLEPGGRFIVIKRWQQRLQGAKFISGMFIVHHEFEKILMKAWKKISKGAMITIKLSNQGKNIPNGCNLRYWSITQNQMNKGTPPQQLSTRVSILFLFPLSLSVSLLFYKKLTVLQVQLHSEEVPIW